VRNNVVTKYYYGTGTVTGVKVASPDINHGAYTTLSYTLGSDVGGNYVQFTVPQLQYWDTILVQR
jgi:dextranase